MKTLSLRFSLCAALLATASWLRAEKPLALDNGGFEQPLAAWNNKSDNGMSVVAAAAAHSGKLGLRVTDASDTLGSSLAAKRVPAVPGQRYAVRFAGRVVSGEGIAVYLRFYDVQGKPLNSQQLKNEINVALKKTDQDWKQFTAQGVAPADATRVEVWIHSYTKNVVTADFDDFVLVELGS